MLHIKTIVQAGIKSYTCRSVTYDYVNRVSGCCNSVSGLKYDTRGPVIHHYLMTR